MSVELVIEKEDIYIKSSIIYKEKSVVSFINKKLNQNYKDFFLIIKDPKI